MVTFSFSGICLFFIAVTTFKFVYSFNRHIIIKLDNRFNHSTVVVAFA